MPEKEQWRPQRRIYHWGPWIRAYHWGLKKDPITEDLKRTPPLRTERENFQWGLSRASRPWMTFAQQKTLFTFFVIVYDRVSDEDKFSYENCGVGGPRFHAAVT